MSSGTLALILVVLYLSWRLYDTIGKTEAKSAEKIKFFSDKTGQIIEMKIIGTAPKSAQNEGFNDHAFIAEAKLIFQMIANNFVAGKINELKPLLSPKLFQKFKNDIEERKKKNETVDFSLVCFSKVDILNKNKEADKVSVQFVTEQINLLKNEKGEVIEGDPMRIAQVSDTWTFQKEKSDWIVTATKSEGCYV